MRVLLNRGSLKSFRRNHEQMLDQQLEYQPCDHKWDVHDIEHTCRRSFTCVSTLTTVFFSTCQDNIHKMSHRLGCLCSPGSWKHLQLWGRRVCGHCQDHMPSSLGNSSWASAPLLELQLRTNERKSRISQFSLDWKTTKGGPLKI